MRTFAVPLFLFAAGFTRVCGTEDKAEVGGTASASGSAAVAAAADVKATLAPPRIGGSVVSAGDFSVELALHQSGLVEALVSDAQGKLVSDGVKLAASVQLKGGSSERLELSLVPPRGRFEGRVKAGAELVPGPVDVALEVGGKVSSGKLALALVAPDPQLGGNVLVAGGYSAELFARPSGEVLAFVKNSAGAEVHADTDAKFKVFASAKGGAREEIALQFDAPRACFAGKAKAGVELSPGPIELVVDAKLGAGIGRLASIALSVDASHGGQIVAVGDYSVELVATGASINAFVFDASGKAQAAGDLDLKLAVGAGAGTALALKWDPASLSYSGSLDGKLDLSLQPLRISLKAAGKAFVGAVASLRAAAKLDPKLAASAKLGADAKLSAAAKAQLDPKLSANAKASAAKAGSASLNVTAPKLDVSTKQSTSAGAKAGTGAKAGAGAKASAGFSLGTK